MRRPSATLKKEKEVSMRNIEDARDYSGKHAVDALKAIIGQVSAFKLKEIQHESTGPHREIDILAHIDVYGRSHTLACKVTTGEQAHQIRPALRELRRAVTRLSGNAMPVLIAPHLSPEARMLCWENEVGFLDLEGNAYLVSGEAFIAKNSLPHHDPQPVSALSDCDREGFSVVAA
jgi:hypothetical protein